MNLKEKNFLLNLLLSNDVCIKNNFVFTYRSQHKNKGSANHTNYTDLRVAYFSLQCHLLHEVLLVLYTKLFLSLIGKCQILNYTFSI